MVAEGIHSIIDAISQLLLIWGIKISSREADSSRPFGYGKELYFWSFMVSLVIFILGGCISFYEGLMRLDKPEIPVSTAWNYSILGIAFLFTIVSLVSALRAFNKQRMGKSFWETFINSKDPSTFIVLLGDVGDILGLVIAFIGIYLGRLFHNQYYDGVASMGIGVMMICISALLVRESKSLLMGETIGRKTLWKIVSIAEADESIIKVKRPRSMYLAPEEVLLQLNTVFRDNLTTRQITDAISRITKNIQAEFPKIKQIFIEPVRR